MRFRQSGKSTMSAPFSGASERWPSSAVSVSILASSLRNSGRQRISSLKSYARAPIVSDTGVMASPVKSLFQTASIGLKTILWGAWGLRAVGHAQWISGATW